MPIKGATYTMKKTSKGEVRLAFVKGKVVEAKNMKTGKTHTPAEFKADMKKMMKRKVMKKMMAKKLNVKKKK
jgi:hypothetical protein